MHYALFFLLQNNRIRLIIRRMKATQLDLSTRVAGIPAVARLTYANYTPPDPGTWDSEWDFFGGWELHWEICDQRGRPAPWLSRKATDEDRQRIEAELINQLEP